MKKTRTCAECIHVSLCTLYWAAEVSSVRWHTIAEESDIGGWYRRASRRNLATGGWLVSNNYDVRRHRPRLRYANINRALKSWQLQPVESTETSKPEEQPSTIRSREIIVAESMKSVWLVLVLVCVCVEPYWFSFLIFVLCDRLVGRVAHSSVLLKSNERVLFALVRCGDHATISALYTLVSHIDAWDAGWLVRHNPWLYLNAV